MKNSKINKSLILATLGIVIFSILLFVAVLLFQKQEAKISDLVGVEIETDGFTENIKCYEKENAVYVFLPSNIKSLTLTSNQNVEAEINDLQVGVRYQISDISLEQEYDFRVKYKNKLIESKFIFMQSKEIPSLFINTKSGSMEYVHAVKGNSEKGVFSLLEGNGQSIKGDLRMQGRGNTSWTGCEKKGYKLEFDQEITMLDLKPSNTYLLIANARSNYLSNTIAFWLSQNMGVKYVPNCRHVDLYLNGDCVGNYILCEQITVSKNSINITNLQDINAQLNPNQKINEVKKYQAEDGMSKGVLWINEPENVTGGFFLERDVPEYYKDEVSGFILNSGDHFVIKGPKHAGKREVDYIHSYMQETYDAISNKSGYNTKTGKHYTEYLDLDSFIIKYVIEEFLNFNDAGRSSAYYYKDVNDKLTAGPGWDFEGAFKGNSKYITKLNANDYSTDWYERLLTHTEFNEGVKIAYKNLLLPLINELLNTKFDALYNTNLASSVIDEVRWDREDFYKSCEDIKIWMRERVSFLSEQWLSGNKYFNVTIESEWQNKVYFYLKPGETMLESQMPQYVRDGYVFNGWKDKASGLPFDFSKPIESDVTLQATWVKTPTSILNVLKLKVSIVVIELIFAVIFIVVLIVYVTKFLLRRNKNDV